MWFIKLYKRYKELEEIRLKYERLQYCISRVIKAKTRQEAYKLHFEICSMKHMEYGTTKKMRRLIEIRDESLRGKK